MSRWPGTVFDHVWDPARLGLACFGNTTRGEWVVTNDGSSAMDITVQSRLQRRMISQY